MSEPLSDRLEIENNKPFAATRIREKNGREHSLRCAVDTGCMRPFVVPEVIGREISRNGNCWFQDIRFADGTWNQTKICPAEVFWLGRWHPGVAVTILDSCLNPLVGMPLLKDSILAFGAESGFIKANVWFNWILGFFHCLMGRKI
jgi:hypothetical protein